MRLERALEQFIGQYLGIIALVIALICMLWLLFYFLGMMGKIGLIKGASQADGAADNLTFSELWSGSTTYFWRMFGVNLLVGLPFFLLVVVLLVVLGIGGYSTFNSNLEGGGMAAAMAGLVSIFIALICIISLISIVVRMILEQAQNAIVLEDVGVLASLGRGWAVFKSALWTIVLLAIIMGIINSVVGLVIALPLIAVIVPLGIFMATSGMDNFVIPLVVGAGCVLFYLPVLLLLSGILQTYSQAVWTLAYRRLTEKPAANIVDANEIFLAEQS